MPSFHISTACTLLFFSNAGKCGQAPMMRPCVSKQCHESPTDHYGSKLCIITHNHIFTISHSLLQVLRISLFEFLIFIYVARSIVLSPSMLFHVSFSAVAPTQQAHRRILFAQLSKSPFSADYFYTSVRHCLPLG